MTTDLSVLFGLDTLRAGLDPSCRDGTQRVAPGIRPPTRGEQPTLPSEACLLANPGVGATERELLEALLCFALPRAVAVTAAMEALRRYGSLAGAASAPWDELAQAFSTNVAVMLKASRAVGVGMLRSEAVEAASPVDTAALARYLRALLARERVEVVRVFFLDPGRRLIAEEEHARGTAGRVPVSPQGIARRAVRLDASSVIVAHNHPSGDLRLSADDIEMTACLREVLAAVDVKLCDHLVISDGGWLSFRQERLL